MRFAEQIAQDAFHVFVEIIAFVCHPFFYGGTGEFFVIIIEYGKFARTLVGLQMDIRNDCLLTTASVLADCLFDSFFERDNAG